MLTKLINYFENYNKKTRRGKTRRKLMKQQENIIIFMFDINLHLLCPTSATLQKFDYWHKTL